MSDSEINFNEENEELNYNMIMSKEYDHIKKFGNKGKISVKQLRQLILLLEKLNIKYNNENISGNIETIILYITSLLNQNKLLKANEFFNIASNDFSNVGKIIKYLYELSQAKK